MGIGEFPRSDDQSQGAARVGLLKFLIEGFLEAILGIITSLGHF